MSGAEPKPEFPELKHNLECVLTESDGSAVPGATVAVYRRVIKRLEPYPESTTVRVDVPLTDDQGKTNTSFRGITSPEGGWCEKNGFYKTNVGFDWNEQQNSDQNPSYTMELKATLKRIKNPIPMHAITNLGSRQYYVEVPRVDQPYGFDLKRGEPLPPLGSGEVADFHFKVRGSSNGKNHFDRWLDIEFANPGDGLVEFSTPLRWNMEEPRFLGSEFQSDYEAPADGYVAKTSRHDVQAQGQPYRPDINHRRNFYFRCRTQRDASGKIVSAHYGKIYGDIKFLGSDITEKSVGYFGWTCSYFNPTPNDRNVEFDPKRNLNPGVDVTWP